MPPPNPQHKRTAAQRAADAVLIEKWLVQGHTHANIAAMLSHLRDYTLTRQQISLEAAKLTQAWKEQSTRDLDEALARILAALDLIEQELWESWDRSKIRRPGNVSFIRGLLDALDLRAELLGLYPGTAGKGTRGGLLRFPAKPFPVVRVVYENGSEVLGPGEAAGELPPGSS